MKRRTGFSLIEIMFVIVLIGIITTVVVTAMQNRILTATLNKSAGEMELILQAYSAYYVDNKKITTNMKDLQPYLTIPMTSDGYVYGPWGQQYLISATPSNQPTKLQVSLVAPTDKIGQGLTALLPGASYDSSSKKVTASLPLAAAAGTTKTDQYGIFLVGSIIDGTGNAAWFYVKKVICPTGFVARSSVALPRWEGLNYYSYFINPRKSDGTAHVSSDYYFPIDHFSATISPHNNSWRIVIYYTITTSQSEKVYVQALNKQSDYYQSGEFTTVSTEKGIRNTPNPPSIVEGVSGLYAYQSAPINNYQYKIFALQNRVYKFSDTSWGPFVETVVRRCGNPICDTGDVSASGPVTPMPPIPVPPTNNSTATQYGYIGQLTLNQWCEKS